MPNIIASEPIDVAGLLSRGRIEVPQYQRSYSWTEREITEFLEDLYSAVTHSESWFLGIIYTYHSFDDDAHARRPRSLLLDGQQRLTTLFILLKELTVYWEILPDSDVADAVRTFANASLTSLVFETATETPRLVLDEANRKEFAEYLRGQTRDESTFAFYRDGDFAKSHELINDGILIIRNWLLKDLNEARGLRDELEHFKRLVTFVLYEIELIEIRLDNQASFYNIFENINDRGRRLTDSDKFKNRYCSLIPKNQIASFESEWFQLAKSIYSLKRDLDKDLFSFYFRSVGEDDLNSGGFYRHLRNEVQRKLGNEKTNYVMQVWAELKDMTKLVIEIENLQLVKLYQGTPGNNLLTMSKVVNVLVRDMWRRFDQYGVIVFALGLAFRERSNSDRYIDFLEDLLNAGRWYLAAHLMGEGANDIRNYTITIARGLKDGRRLMDILQEDEGAIDFASRFTIPSLDVLCIPNNEFSRLLLTFIQAHVGRETIEHYDPAQNWTLEHLLPKQWELNWSSTASIQWSDVHEQFRGKVVRQLQTADLNRVNKCWIQELLGNKFLMSFRQNNQSRHDGLTDKQARLAEVENAVVMPTIPGKNIPDYSKFGVQEILTRTEVLAEKLVSAIRSTDLP